MIQIYLLIETYKVKLGPSPSTINDIIYLDQNTSYYLTAGITMTQRNVRANKLGFEAASTIGSVLWGKLPCNLKNATSLTFFKHKIKNS